MLMTFVPRVHFIWRHNATISCINYVHGCVAPRVFWSHHHHISIASNERHVVFYHGSFDCLFNSSLESHQRNIKVRVTGPLWWEFTGDRWIPSTKGQKRGKNFHLMTPSCLAHLCGLLINIFSVVFTIESFNCSSVSEIILKMIPEIIQKNVG